MQINMHITPQTETETLFPLPSTTSHPPQPPSPTPHLYFAYGSNLSPTQMAARCTITPSHSAKPLAIASLSRWRWHINEAGYANVLPPAGLRISSQLSRAADQIPVSGAEDAVYGVLYEMDGRDEEILDGYEGIDREADFVSPGDKQGIDIHIRPREQGEGDYNKWYVDADIGKWLDGEARSSYEAGKWRGKGDGRIRVLVYVDEERVVVSRPKEEYIPRMNRAIKEAGELGVSRGWMEEVLRRFIPEEY